MAQGGKEGVQQHEFCSKPSKNALLFAFCELCTCFEHPFEAHVIH